MKDAFRTANALLKEKKYQQAIKIYDELCALRPDFAPYRENRDKAKQLLSEGAAANLGVFPLSKRQSAEEGVDIIFVQIQGFVLSYAETIDKLCFYVSPLGARINTIYVFGDAAFSKNLAAEIDAAKHPSAASLLRLITVKPLADLKPFVSAGNGKKGDLLYIFDHQIVSDSSGVFRSDILALQKRCGAAWRIFDDIQHHGSFYLKSLAGKFDPAPAVARLKTLLEDIRQKRGDQPCYVAGTGPSLKYSYLLSKEKEGLVIMCNSAVYNPTIMEVMKPHIVCASDPIFHAGWGKYASGFRTALIKVMNRLDFALVVPDRDYHIYLNTLPESLHSRIHCFMIAGDKEEYNFNLIESQAVKTTQNVLTLAMLPIAASVSKEIYIGGCDGKKVASSYFWEHDKSSQLNQHMEDIKQEFKGFFDISYDKYYDDHCKTLDAQIKVLAANNYAVASSTPSYIPALEARARLSPEIVHLSETEYDVAVIMPIRNCAPTVCSAIESVFKAAAFARVKAQVIAVDDASTDATFEIVRQELKDRVAANQIVIIETPGIGVSGARNIGLALAKSKYIAFLDGDDLMSEDSLAARITALESVGDEKVLGSFSKTQLVELNSGRLISTANNYQSRKEKDYYTFADISAPAHISSILYKSQALEGIRFQLGMRYGEDWLFLSHVLRAGAKLVFSKESHTVYHINQNSATQKAPENHILALFDILERLYFEDLDCPSPATEFKDGLSALRLKITKIPKYEHKIAELMMRLIGCLMAQGKYNDCYQTVRWVLHNRREVSSVGTLVTASPSHFASVMKREFSRFNLSTDNHSGLAESLRRTRCIDLLPELGCLLELL